VLTVTKPDRLARSTAELLSIEADLTKRGIGLVVLSMGGERLDTQREGIAKAKAAGAADPPLNGVISPTGWDATRPLYLTEERPLLSFLD
jgi:Resolvase, N terminal domain